MLIFQVLGIVFFSLLLIKATDILVVHLKALARKTALGGFVLTSLILGLATSFPELFVGITSALEGFPNISLGNVIGSNIADLSLVVGLAAVFGGSLRIRDGSSSSDLLYAFLAGATPLILLWDKTLSRIDGLILVSLFGFYNFLILGKRVKDMDNNESFVYGLLRRLRHNHSGRDLMYVFLGLSLLLFSADMIVRLGRGLAESLGIPILLVGLFLVAVGTSLPELAFEFKAVRKRESGMFMGNLLGSVVANGTLVIGVTALLRPISILAFGDYLLASIFFVLIFSLFYFFIKTKHQLERWEGAVLLAAYFLFFVLEVM